MKNYLKIFLGAIIFLIPLSIIVPRWNYYTEPYYTESTFKAYENAFNTSQYRKEKNPGIIPDETLFSYVSGAYLRGLDPIMANSEHTPLGKYFIALSIYLFHNDRFPTLVFAILTGISIWLVSKVVIKDSALALIPLLFVELDVLFINQLKTAPLLDIIQLPFIYFALRAFLQEIKSQRFLWTSIWLGLIIATKTIVPGIIMIICMTSFLLLQKKVRTLITLYIWLLISFGILLLSYIRTFMNGYTFWEFLKFQKWIFDYQGSKLIYPFSSLRLLIFNQWQTWWDGNKIISANDWSYFWPISFFVSFIIGYILIKKRRFSSIQFLLFLWVFVYQAFLCLGVVSSRFFLLVLPAQYILTIFALQELTSSKVKLTGIWK